MRRSGCARRWCGAGAPGVATRSGASLNNAMISMLGFLAANCLATGEQPARTGNDHAIVSPYGMFRTADGEVAIAPSSEAVYYRLLDADRRARVAATTRDFRSNDDRVRNRRAMNAAIEQRLEVGRQRVIWIEKLNAAGVPCDRVMTLPEVFADPQTRDQEMVVAAEHPGHGRGRDARLSDQIRRGAMPYSPSRPRSRRRHRRSVARTRLFARGNRGPAPEGGRVMRMRYGVAGLFFALLFSCSPVPDTDFALASVTPATARIDAGLAAVTVEPASRDRAVYPLPRSLTPLLPLWQAALQDAVTRQGIFRPDAARRVSLVVKVLEFSLSGNILSVFARYQLFDVPAGNPVFSADIMSNVGLSGLATGVTSLDDPAIATQNRTQVIRAIQDNITQFLDQLAAFARQPRGGHSLPGPERRQIEAFCHGPHCCADSRCMLGTAPVWRGAFAQAHVACRDPMTTKKGCCGAFARAADEDAFPLASETTGVSGLAARYAAALFDLADERRILDEVASDLRQLRAMVQASPDLLRLIRSPILSRDEQSKGIEALAEAAGLSPLVRDFLAVVARNRRLFAVPAMIEAFLAELAARRGEVTAEVSAAQPLSEAQLAALNEQLRRSIGSRVSVDVHVDPGLIGGLVVKLGSRMVDGSIKSKLQRLQLAMKSIA